MIKLLPIVVAGAGVDHGHEHFAAARDAQLLAEVNAFNQLPFLNFMLEILYVQLVSLLEFVLHFGFIALLFF